MQIDFESWNQSQEARHTLTALTSSTRQATCAVCRGAILLDLLAWRVTAHLGPCQAVLLVLSLFSTELDWVRPSLISVRCRTFQRPRCTKNH